MKNPGLSPALAAATLFLAGVSLAADNPQPATEMRASRGDELLKRFDKNGDGKLDEAELADAHEAMLQEQMSRQAAVAKSPRAPELQAKMLEMFDKNHDGRLDDDERAAMRKYVEENGLGPDGQTRVDLVKRFDKNGDGKLDESERAAMMAFLRGRRPQGSIQMRDFLLVLFDKNADGKLDDAELAELEKTMRPRMEQNPQQLRRFDLNGDGKIDDAEWAAARAVLVRILDGSPILTVTDGTVGTPAEEQARLERVSAEVARRRAAREKAQQAVDPKP
jgi:Ca2+-binding EF-hand superfamily protein